MARELGVAIEEYHAMLQDTLCSRLFSLDELMDEEHGEQREFRPARAPIPRDARPRASAWRQAIAADIARLPERERLVISMYYDDELNLKEIGLVLEVSESRVSQILSQATKRLRARLRHW